MSDTQATQHGAADTIEQVTSKIPTTKLRISKRVAAGKAITEKTKQARD